MQLLPVAPLPLPAGPAAGSAEPKEAQSPSFGEMLNEALEEVNAAQVKADQLQIKFLTGEVQDLHQVVIAMEEARLLTSLAVEVRNRIVESYQEISRMQI
ncbi:MAG: flagellar hook-basal body complex protein FliE [Bacillota bacterium]